MSSMETTSIPTWNLGDRMRKSLRHAGLSVAEMAEYLEVSTASMTAWMAGRTHPRAATVRLWAMKCGVSYRWLVNGDGPAIDADELDLAIAHALEVAEVSGLRDTYDFRLAIAPILHLAERALPEPRLPGSAVQASVADASDPDPMGGLTVG